MGEIIIDIVGWIGSIMLISGYWLNSKGKLTAQSIIYQLLNIVGSIFLIVNTIYYGAYPSSVVNFIWTIVGAYYIVKLVKDKKQESVN